MELGYIQAPHKTFPVVFDSPRNGELQDFPYKRILVSGRPQRPRASGRHPRATPGTAFPRNRGGAAR